MISYILFHNYRNYDTQLSVTASAVKNIDSMGMDLSKTSVFFDSHSINQLIDLYRKIIVCNFFVK